MFLKYKAAHNKYKEQCTIRFSVNVHNVPSVARFDTDSNGIHTTENQIELDVIFAYRYLPPPTINSLLPMQYE